MLQQASRRLPRLLVSSASLLQPQLQGLGLPLGAALCQQIRESSNSLSSDQVQRLLREFSAPPRSLQNERPSTIPAEMQQSTWGKIALKLLMFNDKYNQLIIGGQELYEAIKEQVDDKAMHRAFGMDAKVFYSTYTLLAVHVWLIVHRLGHLNTKEPKFFKQRFYNMFVADVERRIYEQGVQVGVSKWMRKLETVFYSSGLSFDKVLRGESEETFEGVVLREFFGNDTTKRVQSQLLAAYLRHQLSCLQLTDDEAIMRGHIQFSRKPFDSFRVPLAPATPAQGLNRQPGSQGVDEAGAR